MTTTLFNLKKKTNDKCDANRCADDPHRDLIADRHPDEASICLLWSRDNVKLCAKHLALAFTASSQGGTETETETEPSTALTRTVVEGVALPPTWLQRAYEIVGEIQDSLDEAKEQLKNVKAFEILNHEDFEMVAAMVRETKTLRDEHETMEKELTRPLNAVIKRIRTLLAPAKVTWMNVESELRGKLKQATLREAERNQEIMAEAASAHAEGGDAASAIQNLTMSSDLDGVSAKIVWTHTVVNVKEMPDEYVIRLPDDKKLKAYITSFDGREPEPVPGVTFQKDVVTRVQSIKN